MNRLRVSPPAPAPAAATRVNGGSGASTKGIPDQVPLAHGLDLAALHTQAERARRVLEPRADTLKINSRSG